MKRITALTALCIFMLTGCWGAALAETRTWEIDKAHSNIYFDIRHTYAIVRGMFTDFSGTVVEDTENPLDSRVEFTVNVASINTHIKQRDDHLRSEDFFSADKYPVMTFKSTAVRKVDEKNYILEGDLTIKDVTRRITAPFTYYGMRDNPLEKGTTVAGLEAEFTVDRLDYNVGDGRYVDMGVIGKDVHVIVTLELFKKK